MENKFDYCEVAIIHRVSFLLKIGYNRSAVYISFQKDRSRQIKQTWFKVDIFPEIFILEEKLNDMT